MTRSEIQRRLEDPQPIRLAEFGAMTGYASMTIRRAIKRKGLHAVRMPGTTEDRIPVDEAARVLVDLRVIQVKVEQVEQVEPSARNSLRFVRA